MRHTGNAVVLTLVSLVLSTTATAQMHPGRSYHGPYGYGANDFAGVWGAYTSAINYSTTRYVAEQDHLAGQNAAMMQNSMMQSGIRNTLSSQADMRTQNILGQQQANRDWWFQVQQQQSAQRQLAAARPMVGGVPSAGFESAAPVPAPRPQVATDIIKWPSLLGDSRFAEQRAKVEAPYRSAPKGQANPTVADYEAMIDAAGKMKAILGQMTAEISAQEYLGVEKFLDQLAAEARGRIKKSGS
jgi:hypothetical protein